LLEIEIIYRECKTIINEIYSNIIKIENTNLAYRSIIEENNDFYQYVYLHHNKQVIPKVSKLSKSFSQLSKFATYGQNTQHNYKDGNNDNYDNTKTHDNDQNNHGHYHHSKRDIKSEMSKKTKINLRLSLLNVMIFTTNNFIMYPSFFHYLEIFELNGFLSGVILGTEYVTNLLNFLIYDRIKSYKTQFILSIAFLLISNVFHVFAFWINSYVLLIISRLFVGLGNIKSLNSGYITQNAPFNLIKDYKDLYSLYYSSGIMLGKQI